MQQGHFVREQVACVSGESWAPLCFSKDLDDCRVQWWTPLAKGFTERTWLFIIAIRHIY